MKRSFLSTIKHPAISITSVVAIGAASIYAAVKISEKRTREQSGQRRPTPLSTFDLKKFTPRIAVPQMPAINQFDIVSAKELGERVEDGELVIGVVIDGKPRAYPINMLTGPQREILNDTLAGRSIAATW